MFFLNKFFYKPEKKLLIKRFIFILTLMNLLTVPIVSAMIDLKAETFGLENNLGVQEKQQLITVTGTVTDETGESLPGVSVTVKGTTMGMPTDVYGKYSLNVPSTNSVLVFSYIGFVPQEQTIGTRTVINIVMQADIRQLEDVVVVAYGTQKKATLTGAVASIGSEEILKAPVPNIGHALAGQLPGLSAIQYSGQPGSDDPTIFVRGIGSLDRERSTPLFMVDGVERPFFQLDPSEIESVSILKDASSTAVFGVRGANGVILVTTKRGQVGKPRISFSTSAGLQRPIRILDYASSYEYGTIYNMGQRNDGVPESDLLFKPHVLEAFRTGSDPLLYPDTDWMAMIIKPAALQTQHNVNISGGTEQVRYFISIGALTQDGIFRSFDDTYNANFTYNRYNYRVNLDIDVTKTTQLKINLGGRIQDRHEPIIKESRLYQGLTWCVPFSGVGLYEGKWIRNSSENVPMSESYLSNSDAFEYFYGRGYTDRVENNITLDFQLTQKLDVITKGLSFSAKGSYNSNYSHTKNRNKYLRPYTVHKNEETGEIFFRKPEHSSETTILGFSESTSQSRNWSLEASLNYARSFGKHNFTALAMYNQWRNPYPGGSFPGIPRGYVGMVGRVTYDYNSRYLLEYNMGYNGSENFAPGNRYGFFPAFSGGWIISEEDFMKGIGFLNYLKIRASYGLVGNDIYSGGRFFFLSDAWNPSASRYGSSGPQGYIFGVSSTTAYPYAKETRIGNPEVTWETARKQNYGVDFAIFNSKLSGTFEYFYEKRDDILTTKNTMPTHTALGSLMPVVNIGVVQNRGFEVSLRWNQRIGDFRLNISPNVSFAQNKVIYKDEIPRTFPYRSETGKAVGQQFGYVFDGFVTEADLKNGTIPDHNIVMYPGDAKYVDMSGDGIINSDDICAIGYPVYPEVSGGLNVGLQYKNFDFSMMWAGATRVSRFIDETLRVPFTTQRSRNLMQYMVDAFWTPETAETATLPRMTFINIENNFNRSSTLNLKDASYLRLKNLQIGYNVRGKWLQKLSVANMRLFATGENLLTFDHLKISDPESQSGNTYNYPLTMIFNFGLNVTFR